MANTTGKKFGGRKKGSQNKVTKEVREVMANASEQYFNGGQFHLDMQELNAKERLSVWASLLGYIMPKLQNVDFNDYLERKRKVEERKVEESLDLSLYSNEDLDELLKLHHAIEDINDKYRQ